MMNKLAEGTPEIVKNLVQEDQQRFLVALAENAALTGFSTFEYSVSIDDLCQKLNLTATLEENLTVLRGLIEEVRYVFFSFAFKYVDDKLWSTMAFALDDSSFTDNTLNYEYGEDMNDYLRTFCHDGIFDGDAFLNSNCEFGIQIPGRQPVVMKSK